jgi:2-oxo-4-hydroxy-4-carboxy-5-ureidoimidazoline decarboxylase
MTIDDIDTLDPLGLVAQLGSIYEHSPWVAERVAGLRPFGTRAALVTAMREEVERASEEEKLTLLCAHPDLGTRARVSSASASEQAGAGLDRLTPEEYELLTDLNTRYRQKFGFPFLYAVKGSGKSVILESLALRLGAEREAEFAEAMRQVHRIAEFRLTDLIQEQ